MTLPEEISHALIQIAVVAILGCGPIIAALLHGCLRRIEHKLDINTAVTKRNTQLMIETKTELKTRDREHRKTDATSAPDATEERLNT